MPIRARFLLLMLPLLLHGQAAGREAADSLNSTRLKAVILGEGMLAAGSLGGLYFLWYDGYERSSFHWINDNDEWLLMDKAGHAMSSYYLSRLSYDLLRWSGLDERRSLSFSAPVGFTYLGIVELMDGHSSAWGASPGDLLANLGGTVLFTGQQLLWSEQRLQLKWSFHRSDLARYRPETLGSNLVQEMLKDYNGQTYWLSANLWSLTGKPDHFPTWLNIALGYSGEGMLGGTYNPAGFPALERYRQFYLSPDIDLSRIRTENRWLSMLLRGLNFIKVPMPAISYDSRGELGLHLLYF